MKRNNNTDERRAEILEAAVRVAARGHYMHTTRQQIADEIGVTGALVQHYFGTMKKLRRAVVRKAIKDENLIVIAQALLARDPHAVHGTPPALIKQAREGAF